MKLVWAREERISEVRSNGPVSGLAALSGYPEIAQISTDLQKSIGVNLWTQKIS